MDYRIGCSGYYYPGWKNKFYPEGLASKNWLNFYSTVFNTVELNGTFYRLPSVAALKRYADATPEDFTFSVKASRYITHIQRLKESKDTVKDFIARVQEGLRNKLSHVLFQLPATFQYSDENLDRVLASIPHEEQNVVEFRHASWWIDQVRESFENSNLTFCNVDYPGLETAFIHTSQEFYLRLHGNPELFKSSYTPIELETFREKFPARCKSISVYFNNTYYEAGYTNASQLMKILSARYA